MNRSILLLTLSAMLPIAACSSDKPQPVATEAPPPPAVAAADQSFAMTAAAGGLAEIQAAQLAQTKDKRGSVKAYADLMIKDHTTADQQLMQIAQQKGITLPTAPTDEQEAMYTKLQGETGREFNHDYVAGQVEDHKSMLATFQAEAQNGADPDLKAFATQTVPIIQHHLTVAEKLYGRGMPTHHHVRHHRTSAT